MLSITMKARQIREWRKDSTEREKRKTRIKVKDIEKPRNFTGTFRGFQYLLILL